MCSTRRGTLERAIGLFLHRISIGSGGGDAVRAEMKERPRGQPVLFESSTGRFRVYDLRDMSVP